MDSIQILNNDYIRAAFFIVGSILLAEIVRLILDRYARVVAARTKSDLDDITIRIIRKPIRVLVYSLGVFSALNALPLPVSYDSWTRRITYGLVILVLSYVAAQLLSVLVGKWLKVEKGYDRTPLLLNKLVMTIVYSVGIIMILEEFNIAISPLVATLGVGGLAVGLALQPTLSNFFSGVYILSSKPVRVGDFIELPAASISGYVEDVSWRTTRIRTLPNTLVIVPNSRMADSIIVNNSEPDLEIAALIQCGVAYGSDLVKVERVTIEVATEIQKTVTGAVPTFTPFIRYNGFGDSNINFTIILRVASYVDQYLVIHECFKALVARYDNEGIDISWPVRKIVSQN